MRAPSFLISLIAIVAILCLTGGVASADPPGANGTVRVHEYPEHKNGSDNANDPKVCRFEIHGNNFDSAQTGRWWIQEHKWGDGDSTKAAAPVGVRTYTASSAGDWTDNNGGAGFKIADGHYKLFVEMKHAAGKSGNTVITYKHKVFKVECPATGGTTTGGTTTGGTGSTGGTSNDAANDTQSAGDTTVRTETTTVVEGGQQFRVVRIFNNERLVNEVRTPLGAVAGFESGPTGQVIVIVEGVQSSAPSQLAETQQQPAGVLGQQSAPEISQLPATSTAAASTAGLAIGFAAIGAGLAMLRRRKTST